MKLQTRIAILSLWVLACAVARLPAQIVADGATNTLSNVTNTITGDVTVGTNGSFTLLILSDNALLTNSVNGLIGRNNTASSNEVRLLSSSARWLMGGSLFVGNNGPFNRLVVSNGATVLARGSGTIGYGGDFSGNANSNTVTVSGAGSLWSNALELVVGEIGVANRLEVNNGGRVVNSNAFVGRSSFSPSNTVVVTGAGSLWSNRADLTLGGSGSGNLLVVSNGGWVVNSNAQVGSLNLGNLALVTGINSTWSNRGELSVGNGGRENQLVVSNGALVVDNNGVLGKTVTSSNNLALITGSGSLWSNGSEVTVGSFGRDNQLIVSNGGWVATVSGYLGRQAGSSNNFALVTGTGSVWSNQSDMYVGFNERSNRLVIEAGGLVSCNNGYIGDFGSASNNEALVTGPGSLWTNRSFLTIGSQAGRNRLVVSNGASVFSETGVMGSSLAPSNQVSVTGAGSVWSNQTFLYLGAGSMGNRADVSAGGWLACNDGYVGSGFGANSNTVTLTGAGSGWNNLGGLIVGEAGNGNVLIASNGATLLSSNATIGVNGSTANNNLVLLTGAGTLWSNRNDFMVGNFSVGNQLVLSNGAAMFIGGESVLGNNSAANSNAVVVTGVGTSWNSDYNLYVGSNGSFGLLIVSNGASAQGAGCYLGNNSSSSNNMAVVTGMGSQCLMPGLFLGYSGRGNRLVVTNGGSLQTMLCYVGTMTPSSNNTAEVTGAGSSWSSREIVVGHAGTGFNQLIVTNGGLVGVNFRIIVGNSPVATNGRVIIDGGRLNVTNATGDALHEVRNGATVLNAGIMEVDNFVLTNSPGHLDFNGGTLITRGASINNGATFVVGTGGTTPAIWDVRAGVTNTFINGNLDIGDNSSFNQMYLTNGATLTNSGLAWVGGQSGAKSNTMTFAGAGSQWLGGALQVGAFGDFNRLVVSDGAVMKGTLFEVGTQFGSDHNEVVVTGAGSSWIGTAAGTHRIGSGGRDNRLTISDGGLVVGGSTFISSSQLDATNNQILVTGIGSTLSNISELHVGFFGAASQLTISNGGWVLSSNGYVGTWLAAASNNAAIVTGAGSTWTNYSRTIIGATGSVNLLIVSNGGRLLDYFGGYLGRSASSSNNLAVVTGPGSVWNSSRGDLFVGENGRGNKLIVSNAGSVQNLDTFCGYFGHDAETTVTDAGSLLSAEGSLFAGQFGNNCRLVVSNGARAKCGNGSIGFGHLGTNNSVLVTGPGSMWTSTNLIFVGGSQALLVVTNGGSVFAGGEVILGSSGSASRIVVDGGTLGTSNGAVNAALDLEKGTNVFNSGLIDVDLLLMTNSLGYFEFNGGTLITRGALSGGLTVGQSGVTPATWHVRAGPSNHVITALQFGLNNSFNQLFLTNGALMTNSGGVIIGQTVSANSNTVTVSGSGSRWVTDDIIEVGDSGSFNRLLVNNGGVVASRFGYVGVNGLSSNNEAVVTGAGSLWTNVSSLYVGYFGNRARLVVSNAATVASATSVVVGEVSGSNSIIVVDGGTLRATNLAGTGLLEIKRGTNVLNAGLIEADILRLTNAGRSRFEFNGGTLSAKSSRVSVGNPLIVGNGISPATFILAGNGTHDFSGTLLVSFSTNAVLTGNGSLNGTISILNGARLIPGTSIGKMIFTTSPSLQGAVVMELSKNGSVLTNDQIQVTGTLAYGGALIVTNLGPTALAVGDKFQLFSATTYAGSFTSLTLPPLGPGLTWKTNLLVDGSIEVFAPPAIPISSIGSGNPFSSGSYAQDFNSLITNGSAVWRDNSTLLGWYAAQVAPPTNIDTYVASDGSANSGALYSFGSQASSERALGSLPTNLGTEDMSYGLCFSNDTFTSVSNFTVTYTGEQWRNGGSRTNPLTFWYRVSPTAITNPEPGLFTNWTQVSALNFISPTLVTPNPFALDGNVASNRHVFSAVFISGLTVPPAQNVFFRWHDVNDSGADQGMAVDDLMISFTLRQPQITSVVVNPTNGFVQLTGSGESNFTYGIETASNLNAPIFWQRIGSNTANSSGVFQFTDTNAPVFPQRFYRALFP